MSAPHARRLRLVRSLPLLGAFLVAATMSRAAVLAADPATGPAMTALAAEALDRSTHVVVGDVLEINDARGMSIAHVKVTRWLKGHAEVAEISVMGGATLKGSLADRSGYQNAITSRAKTSGGVKTRTPGTDEPWNTGPGLVDRAGTSYLLFLSQRSAGVAFALENRIELRGLDSMEKESAVEAQIGLAAIADPEERARRVLAHFLEGLKSSGAWTRANAARELHFLAGVRPQLFDARARARIRRVLDGPSAPAVKNWLKSLESRLGPEDAAARAIEDVAEAPRAQAFPRPTAEPGPAALDVPGRIAALDDVLSKSGDAAPVRALILFCDAPEPVVKAWIVDWLAESGHAVALPALRSAYATEEEPEVREALVGATGLLGADADVPWLAERLKNPRLVEFVVVALARIRSEAAIAALRALQTKSAAGATEEERDLAVRIEHVLSPAFEESERTSGHRLGPERK